MVVHIDDEVHCIYKTTSNSVDKKINQPDNQIEGAGAVVRSTVVYTCGQSSSRPAVGGD